MLVQQAILLLVSTAAVSAASPSSSQILLGDSPVDPVPNPNDAEPDVSPFIFTSLHGLLRQWPNVYAPTGHTIIPGTIPAHTLLYHARRDMDPPPSPEWLAFDIEMSYGIMSPFGDCIMNTYAATRPLKVLYFDGMSAALGASGTLDSQNVFLYGKVVDEDWRKPGEGHGPGGPGEPRGPLYGEYKRARELCKWANGLGEGVVEGFVRMNAGFELLWCDFESEGVELVSRLNVTVPSKENVSEALEFGESFEEGFEESFEGSFEDGEEYEVEDGEDEGEYEHGHCPPPPHRHEGDHRGDMPPPEHEGAPPHHCPPPRGEHPPPHGTCRGEHPPPPGRGHKRPPPPGEGHPPSECHHGPPRGEHPPPPDFHHGPPGRGRRPEHPPPECHHGEHPGHGGHEGHERCPPPPHGPHGEHPPHRRPHHPPPGCHHPPHGPMGYWRSIISKLLERFLPGHGHGHGRHGRHGHHGHHSPCKPPKGKHPHRCPGHGGDKPGCHHPPHHCHPPPHHCPGKPKPPPGYPPYHPPPYYGEPPNGSHSHPRSPFALESRWEWVRSATWHYNSPENRIALDYCRMSSYYNISHPSGPKRAHRLTGVTPEQAEVVKSEVEHNMLGKELYCTGIDWREVADGIARRYLERIMALREALRGRVTSESVKGVRGLSHAMVVPFLEAGGEEGEAMKRCVREYTSRIDLSRIGNSERMLVGAVEGVMESICKTAFGVYDAFTGDKGVGRDVVVRTRAEVEEFVKVVDWAGWHRCEETCGWDEVCAVPLWPVLGTPWRGGTDEELMARPRCVGRRFLERGGGWGPGRPPQEL